MKTLLMVAQRLAPIMALFIAALNLHGQGTAFGYQGRLMDNGSPATGDYDLQFYLRDALVAGNPVGNTNTRAPVSVTDGLFTVTLDFGAGAFTGAALWLEIGVRTNGSGNDYTVLNPRQALTATPYALYATNAGTAVLAATAVTASSVTANAVTGAGIQERMADENQLNKKGQREKLLRLRSLNRGSRHSFNRWHVLCFRDSS